MSLRLENVHGPGLEPHLDALGRLRIAVFREYPYLYDGTLDYERRYLRTYLDSPRSLVVLASDGDEIVGATTCVPLADEGPEFRAPFEAAGIPLDSVFYFGESILLPAYRGQGTGRAFFERREAHARTLPGLKFTAFCAVDRPEDHPRRPAGHRPLDDFWRRMGYEKRPNLHSTFVWKEIDEPAETAKTLTFWLKRWD
ncbi:MAG: GNAT family N-acetyltransferase [Verrucomicrobiae bacterium]|nr:GNAT family N-acetyltransferase [Verrucomicrobiae bacterium]MCP5540698.1 GNAT family N-acetyltransferase [Akkermansiaceae bacterium]